MAGLIFIVLLLITGMAGYLLMPDDTPFANDMHVQLSTKKPGRTFRFIHIARKDPVEKSGFPGYILNGQPPSSRSLPVTDYRVQGDSITYTEYLGDEERGETHTIPRTGVTAGEQRFWLGTDLYGRDLLSRLILGARVSLAVGILAVVISLLLGVTLGAAAGYYGGKIDAAISWLMNILWSLPALLLVIAISFALGKGFWQVFIAVGLSMWVEVARLVRGQVMAIRNVGYVEAARALGFHDLRILSRHILPNIRGPILVMASSNFAAAILLEAGLSFLGFGVQPPVPSWGGMIREHYGYIIMDGAYLAILPGLTIMLIVYSFNLVATGLRDAFDVRTQNSESFR